jgi:hypothetical protein
MHTASVHHLFVHPARSPSHRRLRFTRTRTLWREIGVGLGIAALGLILIGFTIQAGGSLPSPDGSNGNLGISATQAIFAPDAMPVP